MTACKRRAADIW